MPYYAVTPKGEELADRYGLDLISSTWTERDGIFGRTLLDLLPYFIDKGVFYIDPDIAKEIGIPISLIGGMLMAGVIKDPSELQEIRIVDKRIEERGKREERERNFRMGLGPPW